MTGVETVASPIPVLMLLTSLVPGVVIFFLREEQVRTRTVLNLGGALAKVALVVALIPPVLAGTELEWRAPLLPGIDLVLRAEPFSLLFVGLSALLWLVTTIYAIGYLEGKPHRSRFFGFFSLCVTATVGIALSGNLVTFLIFYEVLTLATFPLVAHNGTRQALAGARVYLAYTLGGGVVLLLGVAWLTWLVGPVEFTDGGTEELARLAAEQPAVALWVFALLIAGLGVKAAIVPLHSWLPLAMIAPAPVSALLHAVAVVKAGVFTITKIIVYTFGVDFLFAEPSSGWLFYAAAFTIIAASVVALRQQNLKRLLAYSTVAQLSYVVMAAAVLKPLAEVGAAIHMVAHAFGKITLYFVAGAIYTASKKTELQQLRGIGRRMPITMTAFTIGALSMIGVPPTGGFVSKWYILAGAFQADNYVALATIIVSTALNAAYFLPIVYLAWFERDNTPAGKEHGEAPFAAVLALVITAALTLGFFIYNAPAIELESQLLQPIAVALP